MTRSKFLWAGLISLACFLVLGIAVHSKPTSLDMTIAKFFESHRTHSEITVANDVSGVTAPAIIGLLVCGLLAIWIYRRKTWLVKDFIPMALVVAAGGISTLAKSGFHRLRPGLGLSTIFDAEPSFPSSHTVFIAAAGGAFLLIFARRRWLSISIAILATFLMGLDRLVLGVHWLTDIFGSVLLSLGLFLIFYSLYRNLKRSPHL